MVAQAAAAIDRRGRDGNLEGRGVRLRSGFLLRTQQEKLGLQMCSPDEIVSGSPVVKQNTALSSGAFMQET